MPHVLKVSIRISQNVVISFIIQLILEHPTTTPKSSQLVFISFTSLKVMFSFVDSDSESF